MTTMLKILVCFFLSFSLSADEDLSVRDLVLKSLPKKVHKILKDEKRGKKHILSILGDPDHKKDQMIYYEMNGIKYDLALSFKKNKLRFLNYKTRDAKLNLKNFESFFSDSQVSKGDINDHNYGRYLKVNFPKEKIVLTFKNNSSQNLDQLELRW